MKKLPKKAYVMGSGSGDRVLLIDVDSLVPNIALGKMSTFFKRSGYSVDYLKLGFDYFHDHDPIAISTAGYARVYASVIFRNNARLFQPPVVVGGPGIGGGLSPAPESTPVDYSLWPGHDVSYGFMTRGCIRTCKFCLVPSLEGGIKLGQSLDEIVQHRKVCLFDNNILAHPDRIRLLREILKYSDSGIQFDFNQGLDFRLVDYEVSSFLCRIKMPILRISLDDERLISGFQSVMDGPLKWIKPWQARVYLYCDCNTNYRSVVSRVETVKKRQQLAFLMRDRSCYQNDEHSAFLKYVAYFTHPRWKKFSFCDYMSVREKDPITRKFYVSIWESCLKPGRTLPG